LAGALNKKDREEERKNILLLIYYFVFYTRKTGNYFSGPVALLNTAK
jgi:hypothetical protein